MSFLSLRLPPARKVWKSFTSTLGKLHKIRRSRAMKKHRKHLNTTITKPTTNIKARAPKFLATRRFRRKRFATVKSVFYGFHKKPAPVYIDKLFKEPSCELVDHLKPQTSRTEKIAKIPFQQREEEVAGTSNDRTSTSDDIWESVALGSPLMQGIDERAEEFITRVRREMKAEETMFARNL